jgi:adenine deaminase
MGLARILLLWLGGTIFFSVLAWSQAPTPGPPVPLVLAGGTIIDVTDWGRSAKDQPDSIVIVQNGRITDVGPRAAIAIPKGARVIDCTGKFIVPGLIDGFAAMSSQAEANANL